MSLRMVRMHTAHTPLSSLFTLVDASLAVPVSMGGVNLQVDDLPTADDYYVVFINASNGVILSLSSRFSILPGDGNAEEAEDGQKGMMVVANVGPDRSKPTVTVEGPPTPTDIWAFTFHGVSNARRRVQSLGETDVVWLAWTLLGTLALGRYMTL